MNSLPLTFDSSSSSSSSSYLLSYPSLSLYFPASRSRRQDMVLWFGIDISNTASIEYGRRLQSSLRICKRLCLPPLKISKFLKNWRPAMITILPAGWFAESNAPLEDPSGSAIETAKEEGNWEKVEEVGGRRGGARKKKMAVERQRRRSDEVEDVGGEAEEEERRNEDGARSTICNVIS
ncbi:hypothetical protein LINGRAHAP2_LOCUS1355 [Linum grandiflorum]